MSLDFRVIELELFCFDVRVVRFDEIGQWRSLFNLDCLYFLSN